MTRGSDVRAQASDDVFVADARVELEEIAEAVRTGLRRTRATRGRRYAGRTRLRIARSWIPVRGEWCRAIPGFEFQILDADPRRVKRVRIMRKRPPSRRRLPKVEKEPLPDAFTTAGPTGAGVQPRPRSNRAGSPSP